MKRDAGFWSMDDNAKCLDRRTDMTKGVIGTLPEPLIADARVG